MSDDHMEKEYDHARHQHVRRYMGIDAEGRERPVVEIRHSSKGAGAPDAPAYGPEDTSEKMVAPVERAIARIKAELAEVLRHDERTGQPIHRVSGAQRTSKQLELANLENFTLPITKEMGRKADAWHAANYVSPDKLLESELARRTRIDEEAVRYAERLEIERKGAEIARKRRGGSST